MTYFQVTSSNRIVTFVFALILYGLGRIAASEEGAAVQVIFPDDLPAAFANLSYTYRDDSPKKHSLKRAKADQSGKFCCYYSDLQNVTFYFADLAEVESYSSQTSFSSTVLLRDNYPKCIMETEGKGGVKLRLPKNVSRIRVTLDPGLDLVKPALFYKFYFEGEEMLGHMDVIRKVGLENPLGGGGFIDKSQREIVIPVPLIPDYERLGVRVSKLLQQPYVDITVYSDVNQQSAYGILQCKVPWVAREFYPWKNEITVPFYLNQDYQDDLDAVFYLKEGTSWFDQHGGAK